MFNPYKIRDNVLVLHISVFGSLDGRLEENTF
jgi:hypothetical protein